MLNCEICALTQHHCCKASIAFNVMDTLHLIHQAEALNIDIKLLPSTEKKDHFNIIKRGKLFKSLDSENCVFLKEGRCLIYQERPSICRIYGTDSVKCWFFDFNENTPIDKIFALTQQEIEALTRRAISFNEEVVVEIFKDKMKN